MLNSRMLFTRVSVAALCAGVFPSSARAQQQPPPPATKPAESPLARYTGFYEAPVAGRGFEVTLEKDTLYAEPTGAAKVKFQPQDKPGTWILIGPGGVPWTATFTIANGTVTAMVLRAEDGREITFPKIR